jgi:tetratricopeptide (TPR) repeat protein
LAGEAEKLPNDSPAAAARTKMKKQTARTSSPHSLHPADHASALRDYAAVIKADPKNLGAAVGLAAALDALGRTGQAIVAYSAVIRADPAHVRALFARGSLYNRVGDFERANCDLERALELDGKLQQAAAAGGEEAEAAGGKAGGGSSLSMAARAGPAAAAAQAAATSSSSPPAAAGQADPTARHLPSRPRSLSPVVIAKASFSVPAATAAAAAAQAAAAQASPCPPSAAAAAERHRAAGYKARKEGDLAGALARYTRALALHPTLFEALFDRAFLYHQLGKLDASVSDYTAALALAPNAPAAAAVYFNRGISLDSKGDPASTRAAVEDFTSSLATAPGAHAADSYHNRGYARRRLGQLDEAVADYSAALKVDPDHLRARLNRAAVLARVNTPASLAIARADYEAAVKIDPTNVGAHHLLGGLLERAGLEREAEAALTKAIDAAGRGGAGASSAAPSLHARGALRERAGTTSAAALVDLRAAAAADPSVLAFHHALAAALRGRGRHGDAVAALTTALAACTVADPPTLAARGAANRRSGRYGEAAADYLAAIAASPPAPSQPPLRFHQCAGFCLAKAGNFAGAVAQYDVVLGPDAVGGGGCSDLHARLNRGTCLSRLGRLDDALADLDAVLAADPPSAIAAAAYMNKGSCLDACGPARREEAVECYTLALTADAEAAAVAAGEDEG